MPKIRIQIGEGDSLTLEGTRGLAEVIIERMRQISEEGYDAAHDDAHGTNVLAEAAAAFCHSSLTDEQSGETDLDDSDVNGRWPFEDFIKRKGQRQDLVRAGAMVLAAIDAFDRAAARKMGLDAGQPEPRA